ncbi:MAG: type 4a pilus biogenesis protein PilO [Planctomycetota bacterium]
MRIRKDQALVAGAIASAVLAFTFGVWLPESRALRELDARIAAAQAELGPDFLEPTSMDRQQREVDEMRDRLESADRYVPDSPDLASVLRSLTEAVESRGVRGQQFRTSPTRRHRRYCEVPIELEFSDTFLSAYAVLEEIERMPRLVRVDALSFRATSREPAADAPTPTSATFRLSSFYTEPQEPKR